VAAALISALTDRPVPPETVVFGEIALSGEVRPATHPSLRLREAEKLGFRGALVPPGTSGVGRLQAQTVANIGALVDRIVGNA